MAARVLVGVVADDRGVRDRLVDAPVDPREPRRDLVDGAVEVVDPGLQRDANSTRSLRPPPTSVRCASRRRRDPRPRDPASTIAATARTTPTAATSAAALPERCISAYDGSEKITLYSARLFATLISPGTFATSTVTVVGEANGT